MSSVILKLGAQGTNVVNARFFLRVHGFGDAAWDSQALPHFDRPLEIAVRAFQAAKGLKVDGIIGPKTWAALGEKPHELPGPGKQTGEDAPTSAEAQKPGVLRRISAAGLQLIRNFEGFRDKVYLDPVGKPTVGYGHLLDAQERERWPLGTKLSRAQLDELLATDLRWAEEAVSRLVRVPLSDNQFAALVSFTFNCGAGALEKSSLLKKLNGGDYAGAALGLLKWNKAGGKVLPGLMRRREAEKELFERR